jgi:hypothetical protein
LPRCMSSLCSSLFTSFRCSSLKELGVCSRGTRRVSSRSSAYVAGKRGAYVARICQACVVSGEGAQRVSLRKKMVAATACSAYNQSQD